MTPGFHQLFSVPVLVERPQISARDLEDLTAIVLRRHQEMINETAGNGQQQQRMSFGAASSNDKFFEAQQRWEDQWMDDHRKCALAGAEDCAAAADASNSWAELRLSPAYKAVRQAIRGGVSRYLMQAGVPDPWSGETDATEQHLLNTWLSVHSHGVWHTPHTHFETLASGTLYLSVPSDGRAGRLLFQDPRRSHAKEQESLGRGGKADASAFDRGLALRPSPGLMAIFPPWAGHLVERTRGEEPRVSLSFNVRGAWQTLAHASRGAGRRGASSCLEDGLATSACGTVEAGARTAEGVSPWLQADDVFFEEVDPQCAMWAAMGECEANAGYMNVHCEASCAA